MKIQADIQDNCLNRRFVLNTFQVSQSIFGDVQNVELIPNGAEIPVTEDNRAQFVEQYVRYLLVSSVAKQFDAFSAGFHKVQSCREHLYASFKFSKSSFFGLLLIFEKAFNLAGMMPNLKGMKFYLHF